MLDRLFRPRPAQAAGAALYAAAVAQARIPALYLEYGAPDTPEGRFEIYTLHVMLLLSRLDGQGGQAAETSQVLFDTYVKALDHGLRELGVGDLSVGKKMRKLGEAIFGRAKVYQKALADGDAAEVEALLGRTVFAEAQESRAPALAAYALRQRDALQAQPLERLLGGEVEWSAP